MNDTNTGWLLLILSISGAQGAARIRVWRSLKAAGTVAIRDGVHLLPARPGLESLLREQQREITSIGGTALIMRVPQVDAVDEATLRALFERTDEYSKLAQALLSLGNDSLRRSESDARRMLRSLKRDLNDIEAVDFFPGKAHENVRGLLRETEAALTKAFSPGEPAAENRPIRLVARADFQKKRWATRKRPWVDRVASAWLIRRFIDPAAHFMWISAAADCPKDAIGFDFEGAAFTHVGELVTFEVLLASFELNDDAALRRLASMVHGLDTGEPSIAESSGFETLLSGARDVFDDDDELLRHIAQTLDFMYAAFSQNTSKKEYDKP